MPDSFGTPQDKAANTASRLGSRYTADTAWSSLDATPAWQLGSDRFAQYSQHLPRRGAGQVMISLTSNDVDTGVDTGKVSGPAPRIEFSASPGPVGIMNMAKNFPAGMASAITSPIQNLAGKFMA